MDYFKNLIGIGNNAQDVNGILTQLEQNNPGITNFYWKIRNDGSRNEFTRTVGSNNNIIIPKIGEWTPEEEKFLTALSTRELAQPLQKSYGGRRRRKRTRGGKRRGHNRSGKRSVKRSTRRR